ncbi:MAG TPA: DUF1615 domain-containing protein [Usitatibacter sp.]|jgi:hypothetical protein|nr:DUF1615 domain-containing protein [Usitatibacter sp.]
MPWLLWLLVVLAGCAAPPAHPPAGDSRALIASYIPASVADREAWAADIYTPMAVLGIPVTPRNVCAIVAVTEQESGFHADPVVPDLPAIAHAEIERRRERLGIPKLVLDAALDVKSTNGKTYRERLDHARTERELSDIYEDFIGRVPFGRTLLESGNPVRTGGPMQVSVAFARAQAEEKKYPYAVTDSLRDEVFTRRGGMYFGIAHLLDYPASYDRDIYRFADFNAGRYASRNAAFQAALGLVAHRRLALDGDLVPAGKARDGTPGETEAAALSIAKSLDLDASDIHRDLAREGRADFESTPLYRKVFDLADRRAGKRVARAVVPSIELHTPKTTRRLTTRWFAERVAARQARCLNAPRAARGGAGAR